MNETPEHAAAWRWLDANLRWSLTLERCRGGGSETARVLALAPVAAPDTPTVDERHHRVA